MNKPIKWTLIGLGIFVGVVIVGFFGSAIVMGIIEAEKDIKKVSKAEEEIIVSEEKETIEELEEKEKIIGYRDTKLRDKVPVVEWGIGNSIVFRNGLKATLNKVWEEKRLEQPYVVINVTVENTTDKVQEDWIIFTMPTIPNVWDSEDNRFSGSSGFTIEESIWSKIDSLSPGENKKWPPGKELTGNIYFDVSGNTGDLMVELEYSEFIRPNVIYRYCLEDIGE